MIDPTNSIPVLPAVFAQAQAQTHTAIYLAAAIGGAVVHAYHTAVRCGGAKRILSNFWNGEPPAFPATINLAEPIATIKKDGGQ